MHLSSPYSPSRSPSPLAARRRSVQLLRPRRPALATARCSVDAPKQQVQVQGAPAAVAAEAPAVRRECYGVFCTTYDLKADDKTKSWKSLVNVAV